MLVRIIVAIMFFLGCCLLVRSLLNLIPAIKEKRLRRREESNGKKSSNSD